MREDFTVFGPVHLAIIAATPAIALVLARISRTRMRLRHAIRLSLAAVLMGGELLFYGYMAGMGVLRFPDGLPLQFCNIALWITVLALAARASVIENLAWYLGAIGPTVGLLVPQLWLPASSLPSVQYFIGHAGVLVSILFLVLSGEMRPSAKAAVPAFVAMNAIAAGLGVFDHVYATNYMFLRQKPAAPGPMLELLGPWPWYLLASELLAVACLFLLALPFRSAPRRRLLPALLRVKAAGASAAPAPPQMQSGD